MLCAVFMNQLGFRSFRFVVTVLLSCILLACTGAASESQTQTEPWLRPYSGPSRNDIDATTLDGKVLCGYQGWFNTPGDGTDFGFSHWGQRLEQPDGRFVVDMWPDLSEYDPADLHEVPGLKMPD